jgi:hypothetical protein
MKLSDSQEEHVYQIIDVDERDFALSKLIHHGVGVGDKIMVSRHKKKIWFVFILMKNIFVFVKKMQKK